MAVLRSLRCWCLQRYQLAVASRADMHFQSLGDDALTDRMARRAVTAAAEKVAWDGLVLSRVLYLQRWHCSVAYQSDSKYLARDGQMGGVLAAPCSVRAIVVCRSLRAVEPMARVEQLRCRELRCLWQSRASRSVFHPARLETRTEESNMCASRSVLYRLERRNESKLPDLAKGSSRDQRTADPRERRFGGYAASERIRWYPKDGELCLGKMKPEETLVEVCSDSDVQIDRQTWV
jgi:hypothetical protein